MTSSTSGAERPGASVVAFVDRVTARVTWTAAMHGAAAGLVAAAIITFVAVPVQSPANLNAPSFALLPIGIAAVCAAVGAIAQVARTRRSAANSAQRIERAVPSSRNVVFTANELARKSADYASNETPVASLVFAEANRIIAALDATALVPARSAFGALVVGVVLAVLVAARDSAPLRGVARVARSVAAPGVPRIDEIMVTVTPPAYTGQAATSVRNAARIEALQGSRLSMVVTGVADSLQIETLDGVQRLGRDANGDFRFSFMAEADGFIGLSPYSTTDGVEGRDGAKRLVGLSVTTDQSPRVRITAPARDLFLRDSAHVIDLAIESDDDLALQSLRLRYTKVSGSGERFTFTDGEVPLALTRGSARAWTARARWPLAPLGLSPGDMVVYRAVATDRRPGAPPQESDALIAEIVAIGGDAAAGFAIDPDQERYAVSQQMIVIKTERLIARRASMPPDSLTRASQELAAEQRKVRAEFVFMMGGELADAPDPDASMNDLNEEAEAEAEDDILAGRLENRGRIALMRAIRAMSRAATELTNVDLTSALALEKSAVTQLELAFARTRILLRALSEREALDESRRLTGQLSDARSDRRAVPSAAVDGRQVALQRALADLADIVNDEGARTADGPASRGASLSSLAESVLRVDPSSVPLQRVSRQLSDAARSISGNPRGDVRVLLDSAVVALAATVRREQASVGTGAPSFPIRLLRGAIVDQGARR